MAKILSAQQSYKAARNHANALEQKLTRTNYEILRQKFPELAPFDAVVEHLKNELVRREREDARIEAAVAKPSRQPTSRPRSGRQKIPTSTVNADFEFALG